jgi:hypothetical protein
MKISLTMPGYGPIDSGLPTGVPTGGLDTTGAKTISTFIDVLLIGATLYAVWLIIMGGMAMSRSRGNKEIFKKSWDKVLFAIIGLIFIFIMLFVINVLGVFYGASLLPFLGPPG